MKFEDRITAILFLALLCLIPQSAFAADTGTIFVNFAGSIPSIINFVIKLSYISGIFLMISAVYKLAQVAKLPEQARNVKAPIITAAIGAFMLVYASSVDVIGLSMGLGYAKTNAILAPTGGGTDASSIGKSTISAVMMFVQLLGYIAFLRGLWLLNKCGYDQSVGVSKGLTHIFGGAACINIVPFTAILGKTFGFTSMIG